MEMGQGAVHGEVMPTKHGEMTARRQRLLEFTASRLLDGAAPRAMGGLTGQELRDPASLTSLPTMGCYKMSEAREGLERLSSFNIGTGSSNILCAPESPCATTFHKIGTPNANSGDVHRFFYASQCVARVISVSVVSARRIWGEPAWKDWSRGTVMGICISTYARSEIRKDNMIEAYWAHTRGDGFVATGFLTGT